MILDSGTVTPVIVAYSVTHAQTSHRRSTLEGHWLLSASLQTKRCHQAGRHFTRVNILNEQTFRIGPLLFVSSTGLSLTWVMLINLTLNDRIINSTKYPTFLMHTHSRTQWCDVAVSPVLCANRALFVILGTEVGGALQVDQLILPNRPDVNVFGYQLLACPHGPVNHFGGRQVLGLQVHGDLPQVLQAIPAGPYGAGARHTMTFTLPHQCFSQNLDMRTEEMEVR